MERAATYQAGQADWEALTGNSSAAKNDAAAALKTSKARDVEYAAAFAVAVAGDYAGARSIAKDLAKRFPEDTSGKFNYLPALHGLFALHNGSPEQAVELLLPAVAYEFSVAPVDFNTFFGGLNPIWVRGHAYLAEHRGTEAAVDFQKIIDHKGLLASDPIGALAHLELGRAYAIAGERTKAFKDFLSSGKMPIPRSPSTSKPRPSTLGCSNLSST